MKEFHVQERNKTKKIKAEGDSPYLKEKTTRPHYNDILINAGLGYNRCLF